MVLWDGYGGQGVCACRLRPALLGVLCKQVMGVEDGDVGVVLRPA